MDKIEFCRFENEDIYLIEPTMVCLIGKCCALLYAKELLATVLRKAT